MQKIFMCLLTLILLSAPAWGAKKDLINLEHTPWGMPQTEITQALKIDVPEKHKQIVMLATLYNYEAGLIYIFDNDRLVAINIQIAKGLNEERAENLFKKLEHDLVTRYGTETKRRDSCAKEAHCLFSKWNKDTNTDIILQHDRKNGREYITVIYVAKNIGSVPHPARTVKTSRR